MEEKKEQQEEFVWHDANKEIPEFYPDTLIPAEIGDKKGVLLTDCHSEHYIVTNEAKQELQKKLKKFGQWAYLQNRVKGR